jgi:hypothetical protein
MSTGIGRARFRLDRYAETEPPWLDSLSRWRCGPCGELLDYDPRKDVAKPCGGCARIDERRRTGSPGRNPDVLRREARPRP